MYIFTSQLCNKYKLTLLICNKLIKLCIINLYNMATKSSLIGPLIFRDVSNIDTDTLQVCVNEYNSFINKIQKYIQNNLPDEGIYFVLPAEKFNYRPINNAIVDIDIQDIRSKLHKHKPTSSIDSIITNAFIIVCIYNDYILEQTKHLQTFNKTLAGEYGDTTIVCTVPIYFRYHHHNKYDNVSVNFRSLSNGEINVILTITHKESSCVIQ